MPGFLHITVDDEARDLMVNCGLHEALLLHFINLHAQLTGNPASEDLQVTHPFLYKISIPFCFVSKFTLTCLTRNFWVQICVFNFYECIF